MRWWCVGSLSLYWGRDAISVRYGGVDNVYKCVDRVWIGCG
nr:MAG TPA: hypothetical protein [Caudoviricetes sp.]